MSLKENNRTGDKKISLILTLKALETSNEQNPLQQVSISRMVALYGNKLNKKIYCDRKTVGRHIKTLKDAGYNIVSIKGKGVYLKSENPKNNQ